MSARAEAVAMIAAVLLGKRVQVDTGQPSIHIDSIAKAIGAAHVTLQMAEGFERQPAPPAAPTGAADGGH